MGDALELQDAVAEVRAPLTTHGHRHEDALVTESLERFELLLEGSGLAGGFGILVFGDLKLSH